MHKIRTVFEVDASGNDIKCGRYGDEIRSVFAVMMENEGGL